MKDQRLEFGPLTMFNHMKMMHGLDHDFLAHKNQKFEGNFFFLERHPIFYTILDQRSRCFGHFLMIHHESCCQNWPHNHLGVLMKIYSPDLEHGIHIIKKKIQWFRFFTDILKSMVNQWLIFDLLVILNLLNMIDGSDLI